MSARGKGGKAKIHIAKPEPPPFLQRMKEQIVANEDADRKEQSQRKRKGRPGKPDDPDDDPTIVKVGDDDLTEEEYKRMKLEMETQYKLDNSKQSTHHEELNVDDLIKNRCETVQTVTSNKSLVDNSQKVSTNRNKHSSPGQPSTKTKPLQSSDSKKLSYGSSSDDEEN